MTGTKKHKRGTVEAKIVKSNIPVQNGIVHLIDKPLVIMADSLYEQLCVGSNVQVNKGANLSVKYDKQFCSGGSENFHTT